MWQRPRIDVLLKEQYKQDEPPFDPFPTVTNILNAEFCPVASLHDLLYGFQNAMIVPGNYPVGNLFHRYIAHLKSSIIEGKRLPNINEILYDFDEYSRNEDGKTRRAGQLYVEPWIQRKYKEFDDIKRNGNIFFEVSIANVYVPFRLHEGTRSYPIRGIIDELDLDRKRIIERTIKGDVEDEFPPPLKDFQVWLLWKTLSSIKKEKYPKPWGKIDFKDFRLIVETPYKDFIIEKENPEFEDKTHKAFAWISDISKERKATGEAWASRACTFNNRKECGNSYSCYGRQRSRPDPESGLEFRQSMRPYFRPLFWEQMWEHHLLWYQLTMLPEKLIKKELAKYVSVGKIIKEEENSIVLKIDGSMAPVIERHIGGVDSCDIIFGSFQLYIQKNAKVEEINQSAKEIHLKLNTKMVLPEKHVSILFPETSMLSESPWFLNRHKQKDIRLLEKWSLDDQRKANSHSVIRMIECIFGSGVLKKGGESEKEQHR